MTIIKLPPDLVQKIAAGEVIERPASVAKELVENALDAGATRIQVEIRGGGVQLLRVTDNGGGIAPQEVELAFQRHATSKLRDLAHLSTINSLGFRGEALPSIAAAAEVAMVTRPDSEALGSLVRFKDGTLLEKGPRGCPLGTTVTVRNLFSGLPARRKFLHSVASEARQVINVVARYALGYPEVGFLLLNEGRPALQSPGDGDLRSAVASLYGPEATKGMVEVNLEAENIAVRGLVSPPSLNRPSRQGISLFVNRRWVQSALLLRALEGAYQSLLPSGRYPLAVIGLRLPPEEVDVNIHPTKREVRFYREAEVYAAVQKSVRQVLLGSSPAPALSMGGGIYHTPLLPDVPQATPPLPGLEPAEPGPLRLQLPILRVVGQIGNTYIIAEGPDGMYLVDQHTAHERVLYERLQVKGREAEGQGLLDPLVMEISPQQGELLGSVTEELREWGFEVEPFGNRTCIVRSVPALLRAANLRDAFLEILEALEETGGGAPWRERFLRSLACHGAVRAGQTLSIQEMRELLGELEGTPAPYTCPHGRPTMVYMSTSQLEKEFGRR